MITVAQVAVETPSAVTVRPFPKTRAGRRVVPMPADLAAALAARKPEGASPESLVFLTRTGTPHRRSNFRRRIWTPSLTRAKLPTTLRFHDLRHSYATWLITDGVPVNAVQKVMGHANASTTLNRYTHTPGDYEDLVRGAFSGSADDLLTFVDDEDQDGE